MSIPQGSNLTAPPSQYTVPSPQFSALSPKPLSKGTAPQGKASSGVWSPKSLQDRLESICTVCVFWATPERQHIESLCRARWGKQCILQLPRPHQGTACLRAPGVCPMQGSLGGHTGVGDTRALPHPAEPQRDFRIQSARACSVHQRTRASPPRASASQSPESASYHDHRGDADGEGFDRERGRHHAGDTDNLENSAASGSRETRPVFSRDLRLRTWHSALLARIP